MKNSINKKWFTLVELIIVITILAILATIAFISFQGYSAESRDAKVKSEIGNMRNDIEIEMSKWVSVLNFASDTGSNLTALSLGWTWVTITTSNYKAWNVNKTLLGTNTTNTYKIWATTLVGWAYQLAWKVSANGDMAYVLGNYSARNNTTWSWVWYFKLWDYVKSASAPTLSWVVTAISSDKTTITFWAASTVTWSTYITLITSESGWLINSTVAGTPVTDASITALPF